MLKRKGKRKKRIFFFLKKKKELKHTHTHIYILKNSHIKILITYSIYSSLFSSVTLIIAPLGFISTFL